VKAYLINPKTRTITTVEHDDSLESIKELLECDLFDVVRISDVDGIYVDDEGLMARPQSFFAYRNFPHPLAGNGLVLGVGSEGESIEPVIELAELTKAVKWITSTEALAMAKFADEIMESMAVANELKGFKHITVSTADIMEANDYTDEPPPE